MEQEYLQQRHDPGENAARQTVGIFYSSIKLTRPTTPLAQLSD